MRAVKGNIRLVARIWRGFGGVRVKAAYRSNVQVERADVLFFFGLNKAIL